MLFDGAPQHENPQQQQRHMFRDHPLATVSLVELGSNDMPVQYASGCLVNFKGCRFLLTVSHATGNQGRWAVEMEWDAASSRMKLYLLGAMDFLKIAKVDSRRIKKVIDIDFSYKLLVETLAPRHQILSPEGEILENQAKMVLESELNLLPSTDETYGFWGLTRQELTGNLLKTVPKHVTGMKFVKIEHQGLYFFKLPTPYKEYEEYQGCSGAPILDSQSRLVSLVVEGDRKMTGICGVNFQKIRAALEVAILEQQLATVFVGS